MTKTTADLSCIMDGSFDAPAATGPEAFGLTAEDLEAWKGYKDESRPHVKFVTPEDVSQCPVMRVLDVLISIMLENYGRIRLTASDYLPRYVAQQCSAMKDEYEFVQMYRNRAQGKGNGKGMDPKRYVSGTLELKFTNLWYTRIMATFEDIFYEEDDCLFLSFSARDIYEEEGVRGFYLPLMMSSFGFSDVIWNKDHAKRDFSDVWLFMMWRLMKTGSFAEARSDLFTAMPQMYADWLERIKSLGGDLNDREGLAQEISYPLYKRTIDSVAYNWGFFYCNNSLNEFTKTLDMKVTPTSLLKETFQFDI